MDKIKDFLGKYWIALIGVIGVVVAYFVLIKKPASASIGTGTSEGTGTGSISSGCKVQFPLRKGSGMGSRSCEKEAVTNLQLYLNSLMPIEYWISVDGMFGDETQGLLDYIFGMTTVSKSFYESEVENYMKLM